MAARLASGSRRTLPAVGWLLVVAMTLTPPAVAQDLSPQVDRDSPAGIEYQLPLERAREQASAAARDSPGASEQAPLFGVGVEPPRRAPRTSGRDDPRMQAPRPAPELAPDLPAPAVVRAQARPREGGVSELVPAGAAGAGVLLLGGLAGLAWRRQARRS